MSAPAEARAPLGVSNRLRLLGQYVEHRLRRHADLSRAAAKTRPSVVRRAKRILCLFAIQFLKAGAPATLPQQLCQNGQERLLGVERQVQRRRTSLSDEVAAYLEELPRYSGLLVASRDAQLSFSHNTLRDFLAAQELSDMELEVCWELISTRLHVPHWQDAIAMSLGLRSLSIGGSQETEVLFERDPLRS